MFIALQAFSSLEKLFKHLRKVTTISSLYQFVFFASYIGKSFENEKVPNVWITLFNIYPKIRGNLTGASRK